MVLQRGKEKIELVNPVQIAAYLSSGWTEIANVRPAEKKPKGGK